MNKHNLIRLGLFLAEQYGVSASAEIIELPSDYDPLLPYCLQRAIINNDFPYSPTSPLEREFVKLEKIGIHANMETVWVGYSKTYNVLILLERQI